VAAITAAIKACSSAVGVGKVGGEVVVAVAVGEGGGEVAVAVGEGGGEVVVAVGEGGRGVAVAVADSGGSGCSGVDVCDWQADVKRTSNPISTAKESQEREIFVIMYASYLLPGIR
jgi:hypothetical protein